TMGIPGHVHCCCTRDSLPTPASYRWTISGPDAFTNAGTALDRTHTNESLLRDSRSRISCRKLQRNPTHDITPCSWRSDSDAAQNPGPGGGTVHADARGRLAQS